MKRLTPEQFVAKLREARRNIGGGEDCLGCLLERAGLRGGNPEYAVDSQARRTHDFYVTGEDGSHCYIRSDRWLKRVIDASIRDVLLQDSGR